MPTKPAKDDRRQRDGKLTRAGMEDAIKAGGSVLYHTKADGARNITRIEDLPDEAELVEGDAAAAEQALAALDAEQARISSQRAALERTRTRATEAAAAKARADEDAATKKAADDKPTATPPKK